MIYFIIILMIIYFLVFFWLTIGIINITSTKDKNKFSNVSVIVSAHNEEKNIAKLIESLIKQKYPIDYEILIADDRSTDLTSEIIKSYIQEHHYIKLIKIEKTPPGWGAKKWALNQCIEQSNYGIILQTDADCIPGENWIKSMLNEFHDPNVAFVSAPAPLEDENNELSTYYKLDSLAQDALSAAAITHNLSFSCTGRNIGFLKKSFNTVNGYENIKHYISGDDDLLLQKFATLLDNKIVFSFNPNSIVKSPPPSSFKAFLNQRIRYASKSFDYYKLNTTIEFKILLPFLYLTNLGYLISLIFFINEIKIIYLLPILIKLISDYWICFNFFDKINEKIHYKTFLLLSIIHPIYVTFLGLGGPFINFEWGEGHKN